MSRRWRNGRCEQGQGLVEFSILVPVFLLILLGMLEFGFVFDHALTLQYASREGARVGAALANGSAAEGIGCNEVDGYIVAAVSRVLNSPGSRVDVTEVPSITIYKADLNGGNQSGSANTWTRGANPKPDIDGVTLDYGFSTGNWSACDRLNGVDPDSLGVRLTYTYNFVTPLGNVIRFFGGSGWSSIAISDRTVMALNPSGQ